MYTNDLKPDLVITLSGSDPVDLTLATDVKIIGTRLGKPLFTRDPDVAPVVDGDTSVVTMYWQTGDTARVGTIDIEVEVTWPGDKKQTYRAARGVKVNPDRG